MWEPLNKMSTCCIFCISCIRCPPCCHACYQQGYPFPHFSRCCQLSPSQLSFCVTVMFRHWPSKDVPHGSDKGRQGPCHGLEVWQGQHLTWNWTPACMWGLLWCLEEIKTQGENIMCPWWRHPCWPGWCQVWLRCSSSPDPSLGNIYFWQPPRFWGQR